MRTGRLIGWRTGWELEGMATQRFITLTKGTPMSDTFWKMRAEALANALLDIAEAAMPESYYEADSRCLLARDTLVELNLDRSANG